MTVSPRTLRRGAWAVAALGAAAPLWRARLPVPVLLAAAAAAPPAVAVAARRGLARDVAVCALQMWGFVAAWKKPVDDPARLRRRTRWRYAVRADRLLGAGRAPSVRLQRHGARRRLSGLDRALIVSEWLWYPVPHAAVLATRLRTPSRFPRAAALVYATFDAGALVYWLVPTAPPWWVARRGRLRGPVRRRMYDYGPRFWGRAWQPVESLVGGNPLAAMPSVHFATALMAAHVTRDLGRIEGAMAYGYAATLGFALVHSGEHWVVDVAAGAAIVEAIRRLEPRAAPLLRRTASAIEALHRRAHADADGPQVRGRRRRNQPWGPCSSVSATTS